MKSSSDRWIPLQRAGYVTFGVFLLLDLSSRWIDSGIASDLRRHGAQQTSM